MANLNVRDAVFLEHLSMTLRHLGYYDESDSLQKVAREIREWVVTWRS